MCVEAPPPPPPFLPLLHFLLPTFPLSVPISSPFLISSSVPHSSPSFPLHPTLFLPSSKAMHLCDELAGKVQEVEEELAMTVKDLQREQNAQKLTSKQMSEVRQLPESPSPHRHTPPYTRSSHTHTHAHVHTHTHTHTHTARCLSLQARKQSARTAVTTYRGAT